MAWTVNSAALNSRGGGSGGGGGKRPQDVSRAAITRQTLQKLFSGQGSPGSKGVTPKTLTQGSVRAKLAALTKRGQSLSRKASTPSRTRKGG